MAFTDLLDALGGVGRFQLIYTALLLLPCGLLACHNFLQNFTAAVPRHHCRDAAKPTAAATNNSGAWPRATVPLDQFGVPEPCRRFMEPQRALPNPNTSVNGEATESCKDGWVYDHSVFPSTIVTEWDLVCEARTLRDLAQTIYMAGVLLGAAVFGGLADRWLPESSRWLLLHGKSQLAVRNLRKVAAMNGRKEEGDRLTQEVVSSYIQSEFTSVRTSNSVLDLFRTPAIRKVTCCLMVVWFSNSMAYYGLAMDLQKFGFSVYLVQVLFGVIDIPAMLVATAAMIYMGRRATVASFLILAGFMVIANMFVPEGLQALRTAQAALGKGCLASSFICVYLFTGELYPTEIRQMGMGFTSVNARLGGLAAPLVTVVGEFSTILPPVAFGATSILAGLAVCFLAETRNTPLVETIEVMERRAREGLSKKDARGKGEEISLQQLGASPLIETI
ncbi:solute carrier family 22 member 20-like isoform 3-T3 [Glossophaga mutica]